VSQVDSLKLSWLPTCCALALRGDAILQHVASWGDRDPQGGKLACRGRLSSVGLGSNVPNSWFKQVTARCNKMIALTR
jgi:hypothetical protein